jgi:threonine dehydrogenase-like Zn-dependent dehydrogenase
MRLALRPQRHRRREMLTMEKGDVLGHKLIGEVVEVGRQV